MSLEYYVDRATIVETDVHHHNSRRRRLVKVDDHLTTLSLSSGLLSVYTSNDHHQRHRSIDTRTQVNENPAFAEQFRNGGNNRIGNSKAIHRVSGFLETTISNKDVNIIIEPEDTAASEQSASQLTTTMDADSSTGNCLLICLKFSFLYCLSSCLSLSYHFKVECCGHLAKSPNALKKAGPKSSRVNSSPSFKAESPSSTTTDIQSNISLMDLDDHNSLLGGPSSGVRISNTRERWR